MNNINWRPCLLWTVVIFSALLAANRFHIVEYPLLEFHPVRNYLEHLAWGFIAPILSLIFFSGVGTIFRCNFLWKRYYWTGVGVVIFLWICYYPVMGYVQWADVALEIMGVTMSYFFIKTTIKKYYDGKYS